MSRPPRAPALDDIAPVLRTRQTTAEVVADALRDRLLTGEYGPGIPMRESALAPVLGVSRPTMREALQHLVREGLLTHHLNRGMVVAELGPDDVRELYVVRTVLETGGITAAAQADQAPDATAAKAAASRLEAAVSSGDGLGVVDADMAFHSALVALTGSQRLVNFHASAVSQLRLALGRFDVTYGDVDTREHKRMARLLEQGRFDKLEAELRRHLNRASERLTRFVRAADAGLTRSR